MKKTLLLGIMAVALLASVPAFASHAGLSLAGETGIARTPMAISLSPMTLAVAADYVTSKKLFIPMRLEFGVIDGLELGGQYWYTNDQDSTKIWGLNAKYVLPFKVVDNLGIAVGGNYSNQSGDHQTTAKTAMGYAVATYTINAGIPIVPSAGVSYNNVDAGGHSESGAQFFGSVAVMVMPNIALAGEVMSKSTNSKMNSSDMDPNMWFGVRAMPIDNLTVQAGVVNNANIGGAKGKDWTANIGAQYAFGFGK